jgi:solute carrier family 6 (neurotransmitter transporter), invertebrate
MVLGENQKLFGANTAKESGYQALRLVTELFPAALAAASRDFVAPIWGLLGYLTFLFLGLAQLCAMWKPLAGCLGNSPSSVLLSCITGLFLGIPLATESGIVIIHYLDTVLGGAWWMLVLWFAHLFGIFLIRGTPYTSKCFKIF